MPFFNGVGGQINYRVWSLESPEAIVVFLHGLGQQSTDYHRFGRACNRRGIEVWALDHLGHGLSEGDPTKKAALEDLAANAYILLGIAGTARPREPITLMGHSLGAGTALLTASPAAVRIHRLHGVALCGTPKSVALQNFDAPPVPTLLVHGVDDRISPIAPIREWARNRTALELREYPDAGHDLLHEPVHGAVTDTLTEFASDGSCLQK